MRDKVNFTQKKQQTHSPALKFHTENIAHVSELQKFHIHTYIYKYICPIYQTFN